jgi:hypothetical protein
MTIFWNRKQIKPTNAEIILLKKQFGDISIRDSMDIFKISEKVINDISHKESSNFPLSVSKILERQTGYCYDRSLILQKIFLFNKIPLRPVFIYYSIDGQDVGLTDLFDKDLLSHNVFEYYYNGKWNMMRTNKVLNQSISLDDYINQGKTVPSNSKYIRYLNNRSGKFLYPSFIPDIYFFN